MEQFKTSVNSTETEKNENADRYFSEPALLNYIYSIDPRIKPRGIHKGYCQYFRDEEGQGTLLLLRNDSDEHRLLIDYQPKDGNPENDVSLFKSMDLETSQNLIEFYRIMCSRLSSKDKRELLKHLSNFDPEDFTDFTQAQLLQYFFTYFPEKNPGPINQEILLPLENTPFTDKEKSDLQNTVLKFLKLVPQEKIEYFKNKIIENYKQIFKNGEDFSKTNIESYLFELLSTYKFEVLKEVFESESEFKADKFSIESEIKNNIHSIDQVREGLKNLGIPEEFPRGRVSEEFEYKVVALSKVVGGFNMEIKSERTWEISNSEGRGVYNILSLCQTFQNDREIKTDRPICFILKDGKYYCYGDGRHRTVALKLLGVEKIPAKVYVLES